jgi:branched-chain amino acid aminotransferase
MGAINAWHFVDGKWVTGDPLLMTAWSHATWLGAAIFDGARAFEGVTPDLELHCQRAIRSATALGLRSPLSAGEIREVIEDGIAKFPKGTALYLRPFMWSTDGWMEPAADSTKIAISVVDYPLPDPNRSQSCSLSKWRRPSPDTAPTDAKAVCLYAQAGRAAAEAKSRGFDEAVMLDPLGHVAEFAAHTPIHNGCFLNGITRQRVIQLLRKAGIPVHERVLEYRDLQEADEIFSTGNYGKVMPFTRIDDRNLQPGPVFRRARELYWEFAHG